MVPGEGLSLRLGLNGKETVIRAAGVILDGELTGYCSASNYPAASASQAPNRLERPAHGQFPHRMGL